LVGTFDYIYFRYDLELPGANLNTFDCTTGSKAVRILWQNFDIYSCASSIN